MMIQKRFPDLTSGASEIEQDHIHTLYYQKDTARYIQQDIYRYMSLVYIQGMATSI